MVTDTTPGNKLSALVSILSPDRSSSHRGPAFTPIIPLLLSKSLSFSILLRPMVCDHLLGLIAPDYSLLQEAFSFLDFHNTPCWCLPLSLPTLAVFLSCLCWIYLLSKSMCAQLDLHIFSLSTLSLLSESDLVTLNTIYVLTTLNFL